MPKIYEQSGITIFQGDCRVIAPTLEPCPEAVITDPPYGVGWDTDYTRFTGDHGHLNLALPPVHGDADPFDPSPWLAFERCVMFGANHYAPKLPASPTWIVWDKRCGLKSEFTESFADCELAWVKEDGPARIFRHYWNGMLKDSERGEKRLHPTQKPVALMAWIIQKYCLPDDVILDPYMGSGTTLIAAKKLGHKAIGIEYERAYCDIAAARLQQEVFAF